jgi:hypothetical protein
MQTKIYDALDFSGHPPMFVTPSPARFFNMNYKCVPSVLTEKPIEMKVQTRLAEDYRRQLNRLRTLLQRTPRDEPLPSTLPISTQAFGGFLMLAETDAEVLSYIRADPEAAKRFVRDAATWGGLSAPHPSDLMHAVDEVNYPFYLLGWLEGGEPGRKK